jgi:hypothetical protein
MSGVVRMVFAGDLKPASFAEFAAHRAGRLALAMRIVASDAAAVTVDLAGAPDLVDMFEMACSLGPLDCVVHDVTRRDIGDAAFAAGRSLETEE